MSLFLASVANIKEAETVLAAGVDIIDLKNPAAGVLGAVEYDVASNVVGYVADRCLVSATLGDLPMQPALIADAISKMSGTGVDIIKVGIFSSEISEDVLAVINEKTKSGINVVLVLFADLNPKLTDFNDLVVAGISGVMLDTANKEQGSLRTILSDNQLMLFAEQARSAGLMAGLAGSLRSEDIEPLLAMDPDYLGFRGALCRQLQRVGMIDAMAVRRIRAMIPKTKLPGEYEKLEQIAY